MKRTWIITLFELLVMKFMWAPFHLISALFGEDESSDVQLARILFGLIGCVELFIAWGFASHLNVAPWTGYAAAGMIFLYPITAIVMWYTLRHRCNDLFTLMQTSK